MVIEELFESADCIYFQMDYILPTNKLDKISKFEFESYSEEDINLVNVQKGVLDFYTNYSNLSLPKFNFHKSGTEHTSNSFLISTAEEFNQLGNHKFIDSNHTITDYDLDVLDDLVSSNVFADSYYNNTKIAPTITDTRELTPIKTDYYTRSTLSKILSLESSIAGAKDTTTKNDFPVRSEILSTQEDFLSPKRPLVGSGRGIICTKRPDNTYSLLLGVRSYTVDAAAGAISTFPAGTIEEYGAMNPVKTVKREFLEEFFVHNPKIGVKVLNSFNISQIASGWNARSGGILFDYLLYSDDSTVYTDILENRDGNGELEEIIELPIHNFEKIIDTLNSKNLSGEAIHTICLTLQYLDKMENTPDLGYSISVTWN